MRRLILFRHGEAQRPAGVNDRERALTPAGRVEVRLAAGYLVRGGLVPDFAAVSPATRTRETWAELSALLDRDVPVLSEQRLYNAGTETVLDVIRDTGDEVEAAMVVGHNPGLQDAAMFLAGSGDGAAAMRLARGLPTAGFAILSFQGSWAEIGAGTMRLDRFVVPEDLAA